MPTTTRLYWAARNTTNGGDLPPDPVCSPTNGGEWTQYTVRRVRLVPVRGAATGMPLQGAPGSATLPLSGRHTSIQGISAPLPAGPVSGTVAAVNSASTSNANARMRLSMTVRVVSSDGSVVRGVLVAAAQSPTLVTEAFVTHTIGPVALAPVTAQAGDRLLVEFGVYRDPAASVLRSTQVGFGDPATPPADWPFAAGVAGEGVPWVEFVLDDPPPPPAPIDVDNRWWTHRLAASLGLDPVAVQPVVQVQTWTGGAWSTDADLSNALAGYQVTYGRNDVRGDVDPIRGTLTLATVRVPTTPAIATRVRVRLCDEVADALGLVDPVRFTGEVTDPLVDHAAGLTKLVCVGRLGRAYRQPVTTGWPVETDADRIARILAGTGVDVPVGTIDAGTVTLAAAATDTTAARLVEQVTASTLGQLVEQPDGTVDWHGPDHRRGTVPALTLAAAAVFRAITWSQRMADLVNRVTVKVAAGPQYTVDMPWSVDPSTGYGPYPASIDTLLTSELDARTLAARIVARRFLPCWQLPDLQVDLVRTLPLAQLPTVLELRHGHRVELADLPAGCPVPPRVFIEGWTETATPRAWRWSATVSDPIQSGVAVRWIDVPQTGARTWADVDPTLTWLDALRIEDPDDLF